MTQVVHVSRLNPKTTEQDLERFCSRFGQVSECVIYQENDKSSRRSGYVKFASSQTAEKMYRRSREENLYLDHATINVELSRKRSHHSQTTKKSSSSSSSSTTYTLSIEGQIKDDNELINYFHSKPSSIKFLEVSDPMKTSAQVTFNDKDVVDRILQQNHEKYTIKLLSNPFPIKREYEQEKSPDVKRSKHSSNSHLTIVSHLESITRLTHDMHEENERLKNEKSLLTITLNQQLSKIKQLEFEKSDLVKSLSKTHDIAKCLTNKFKLREEEYHSTVHEANEKIANLEAMVNKGQEALSTANNDIERLTRHLTTLERQVEELIEKCTQTETSRLSQQHDIEIFFSALKQVQTEE